MNNVKEEFIMLERFKNELISRIMKLKKLIPESSADGQVIVSQYNSYRAMIGEIDIFIESQADHDKFYNTNIGEDE